MRKDQESGAVALDIPNSQNPHPRFNPFYGSTMLPHPTNAKAKVTHPEEVMRHVNEGR